MQAKDYNNYPDHVKERIDKFRDEGKTVVFRLTNIRPDEDNPGKFLLPSFKNIEYKDYVKATNPKTKKADYFHIAYITGSQADGQANLGRDIAWGRFNSGNFICDPNRPKDVLKYAYLLLSNFNASNPDRDPNVAAEYEEVKPSEVAKLKRESRKYLRDAMNKASELTQAQVEDIFTVISTRDPKGLSHDEKFDAVEQYASDHPKQFMEMYNSRVTQMLSFIEKALKLQVIKNSKKDGTFAVQDKVICSYKQGQTNPTPKELLAEKLLDDVKLLTKIQTLVEISE